MAACERCGCPPPVDVVRDVLDLAATVLAGGPQAEYAERLGALLRTPRESLQVLATVLLAVSREGALPDVRHMALMHHLRRLEAVR